MHDALCKIANALCVRTESYENWIDEFIYKEKEEDVVARKEEKNGRIICNCSLCRDKYSNASSGANRAIQACCCSEEEFKTFRLICTGRKPAVTTISIDHSQIMLPDSLMKYLDSFPTRNDIINHKLTRAKWMPLLKD